MANVTLLLNDVVLKECNSSDPYSVAELWRCQMIDKSVELDKSSTEGYKLELLIDNVMYSGLIKS